MYLILIHIFYIRKYESKDEHVIKQSKKHLSALKYRTIIKNVVKLTI